MTSLELFRALILAMPIGVVSDAIVEQFLTTTSSRLDATAFGSKFAEASVWYAAHLLFKSGTLALPGATVTVAGTVTSLKTGDESIGLAAPGATSSATLADADLTSTHYGQQFLALRNTRADSAPTFFGVV